MKPGIRRALSEASKSNYLYRLGAVITKGKRILGVGYNEVGVHCKYNKWKESKHAEMAAIGSILARRSGSSDLVGATIHVARIHRDSSPALAKPCSRCMELIKAVGIREVIYTTDNGTERIKL